MSIIKKYSPMIISIALLLRLVTLASDSTATITIAEIVPMSFGVLTIPVSSSYVIVSENGAALSGNAIVINDTSSRGQYTVTGTVSQTISIDIQNISTGSSALTLDSFKGVLAGQAISSFPITTLSLPANVGQTLYLGARLQFTPAVTEQTYTMTFDLVINYD